jgi:hypothetical protein
MKGEHSNEAKAKIAASMKRAAQHRRCPHCDRGNALSVPYPDPENATRRIRSCRWCYFNVTEEVAAA